MTRIGSTLAVVVTMLSWGAGARAQTGDTAAPPVATADPGAAAAPTVAPALTTPVATTPVAEPTPSPALPAPEPVVAPAPTAIETTTRVDTAPGPQPSKVDDGDDGNWLDYLRIGAVAGVGFPRPLAIEGMAKIDKVVSIGLEYSLLPRVTIDSADTTFWAFMGDLRVFPLRNGFFIGVAVGHQHVGASAAFAFPPPYSPISEQVICDTWLINPRIGFLSTWEWGLTLGIDVGVQIPLSSSFSSTAPSSVTVGGQQIAIPVASDANNVAHTLGTSILPTVDLLRIGLLL